MYHEFNSLMQINLLMKQIALLVISLLLIARTHSQISSLKQLKDISKNAEYYEALKNLVEKYGVIGTVEKRQDNNYLPDKPLTHRDFAIVMVKALDKVEEKFKRLSFKMPPNIRDSLFRLYIKKHYKSYSDSAVMKISGYAEYKDITNDDSDHVIIKKLTNFYRIRLGETENTFAPDKPMTEQQLSQIFSQYYGERSIVRRSSTAIAKRGKWAIYLDALLERLYATITDLSSSL